MQPAIRRRHLRCYRRQAANPPCCIGREASRPPSIFAWYRRGKNGSPHIQSRFQGYLQSIYPSTTTGNDGAYASPSRTCEPITEGYTVHHGADRRIARANGGIKHHARRLLAQGVTSYNTAAVHSTIASMLNDTSDCLALAASCWRSSGVERSSERTVCSASSS